jgi:hypothetical protein
MTIGLLFFVLGNKCEDRSCSKNFERNCENIGFSFDNSRNYILKTLDDKYIQSCIGCVGGLSECFEGGIQAADNWNGDTVKFTGDSITMNIKSNNQNLLMKTITNPKSSNNIICLTSSKTKNCNTNLKLIVYSDASKSEEKVYRIKSNNGTFIGTKEGILGNHILTDGFTEATCNTFFKVDRL